MRYRFLLRLPRLHAAGQVLTSLRLPSFAVQLSKACSAGNLRWITSEQLVYLRS